jgi:hypothetical protein
MKSRTAVEIAAVVRGVLAVRAGRVLAASETKREEDENEHGSDSFHNGLRQFDAAQSTGRRLA